MSASLTFEQPPRADNLARRFVVGGAWNLLGNAAPQAINLAAQIVISRMLGKAVFGQIGVIYGTLITFGTFAGLGLGLTATKHVAEFHIADSLRAGRIILLTSLITWAVAGLVTVGVALSAPWVARVVLQEPSLVWPLRVGAPLILLTALGTLQLGVLSGFEAFRSVAALNIAKGVCSLPLLVLGARFYGVSGVMAAYVALAAMIWAVSRWMIRQKAKDFRATTAYLGLSAEFPLLWKFSAPAFLYSLLWPLSVWFTNLFVIRLPLGYEKVGELNAIRQLQAVVNVIPVALNGAVMPILTSVLSNTPLDRDRSLRFTNNLSFVAVLPVTLALMIGAPWIMKIYGHGYTSGWPILILMIGATGVNLLSSAPATLMLAKGAMFASLVNSILTSAFMVTVLALTIFRWELYSVGGGTLVCYLLSTTGIVIYAVKCLEFPAAVGRVIISSSVVLAGITAAMPWFVRVLLR
jgi:O-antigen/teichoic acid export membrane protein